MSEKPKYVSAGATISACGTYRYSLWREWRGTPNAKWDMWKDTPATRCTFLHRKSLSRSTVASLPFPNRKGRESKNKLNPSPINNPLAFAN